MLSSNLSNKSDVFKSACDGSVNESEEDNNQANNRFKVGEGYHAAPPPYTRNFMPPKPDLSLAGLNDYVFKSAISKPITSVHETKTSTSKTSKESMERPKTIRPSALIIEDWESNSDDDCKIRPLIEQNKLSHAKIDFVKSNKNTRKSVIKQHTYKQAENLGKIKNSRVDKRDWNGMMTRKLGNGFGFKKKACFVCGSLYHLIKDLFSAVKGNRENAVKSSACWIWRPTGNVIDHISKDSGSYMVKRFNYVDLQGRLKHMMGNKSFLTDYQKIDEGFVAFGGSPIGERKAAQSLLTPQQNGVAERKNRTLIEAARTMLADLLVPTTFWAEAVSTAYYVQSRVLVIKPHNKTPYELLIGRTPNLDFMKPFGCLVTILNTLDHLGKFEGKADEGFLVGYSVNITTGNQTNNDTCIKINANVGKAGQEKASDYEYILLLFMPSSTQSSDDKDAGDVPDKGDECVNKGSSIDDQEKTDSSTQNVGTAEPSINTAGTNINIVGPSMPSLEETGIFDDVYDDREVGAEADTNNLELSIVVWTLVDLSNGKRAIGTKWVFRNKKDERGIVIRNKEKLVKQGYTQEEGINYDEVFALIARIEAIRIFLAYASFMGFIVYQMNVNSAFLYGIIKEEVHVCQPSDFKDPHFSNKVYKVEKALYGLHQASRACYETLSTHLLENRFRKETIDKTLFIKKERNDILLVQVYVDDIIFGSTKKSLWDEFEQMMHKRFQMSSMEELTFFLRFQVKQKDDGIFISQTSMFQVTPKTLHLHAMKRIFRYLKGQPKLSLWYPRDSPFDLEAFSDSDYARASLDRKSTIGGCQFIGKRLISWQCKKQTIVANSSTEAEYVATANSGLHKPTRVVPPIEAAL
nr:retrovirus-related Pol polyprotein from transposon TNT 1-94 [Tanacetum cinerariifolium]